MRFGYGTVRYGHKVNIFTVVSLKLIKVLCLQKRWDILFKKGYQLIDDEGIHTVTTKVKGLGYLKQSEEKRTTNFVHQDGRVIINTEIDGTNFRIFDVSSRKI